MARQRPTATERPGLDPGRGRALAATLIVAGGLLALLLGACAQVEAPPGGPQDLTPPRLAGSLPDSGSVGLQDQRTLRLTFTEKMTRAPAEGWLHFYPPQRIRHTSWNGTREAVVELAEPLPPDTLIVVEVAAALQDAHKVKARESRRFPLATGDSIPSGRLTGALVLGDSAVTTGVAELYPLGPDSLEYFRRPLLRRVVTDRTGRWTFDWLPVPGGPWLVRTYADADRNLRPGEREAQRLLPDTLSLTAGRPQLSTGALTLYKFGDPGHLRVPAFDARGWRGAWYAWTQTVAEADTGWTPAPTSPVPRRGRPGPLLSTADSRLDGVPSGNLRVVFFADVDGDSLLGFVGADTLRAAAPGGVLPDSLTAARYLEPWWLVESVTVPPGLEATVAVPASPPTLTPWSRPDSLATGGAPAPKEKR